MSMERVTLRLPPAVVRAYDSADGNRSALMRRTLSDAVVDGELSGVDDDIRTLAEVEHCVDTGRLTRRKGTFKRRCAEFFADKYRCGYVDPTDAGAMAESWRREATIYGAEYVAWVDAIEGWYSENWDAVARPDWPDASVFHMTADPDSVDVDERLAETVREGKERGLTRGQITARIGKFHPDAKVHAAVSSVFQEGGES